MGLITTLRKGLSKANNHLKKRIELAALIKAIQMDRSEHRIFLFQTPAHSNIGDHAIAQAELDFLSKHVTSHRVFEINQSLHFLFLRYAKDLVKKSDVIMLHGGGNFGNQYMYEEQIRRSTIQHYVDNKIVLFPQTIYYTNDTIGQRELEQTQEVITRHPDITLVAREHKSFEIMKAHFSTAKVLLMPDIVLSTDKTGSERFRSGILMVLRNDEERMLNEEQHSFLDKLACRYSNELMYSDMHHYRGVHGQKARSNVLNDKFMQFKSARLVITDRLHGMVFAAITRTPCIAFSNYNQKVSGTYDWIRTLNFIRFVDFSSDLEEEIRSLLSIDELSAYHPAQFANYYGQLITAIHE